MKVYTLGKSVLSLFYPWTTNYFDAATQRHMQVKSAVQIRCIYPIYLFHYKAQDKYSKLYK